MRTVGWPRFGMRWWLGFAFACVAALTAIAVVALLTASSDRAFARYGEDFAVGNSVAAAIALTGEPTPQRAAIAAARLSAQSHLAIFVFDRHGHLISPASSFGQRWSAVPDAEAALDRALGGLRYLHGGRDGAQFTVGLRIRSGAAAALVAYALRPALRAQLGTVHSEYVQAGLIAFGVGAALGLLIATMTGRRLSRIARAAQAIEGGRFDVTVPASYPDEVGSLALSIERMRTRLRDSFSTLEGERNRLKHLLDRLDEGVLVVGRDLKVEFANGRARELLGVGELLDEHGGETVRSIARLATDLFAFDLPAHLRLADGQRTLEVSGIPPGHGGESAIVVIADASQRERHERVQREFATNAAHQLRTPLASIVTAVEMLRTGAKDDPVARDDFLDLIAREADRLSRLTRALLVLARAELGEEQPRRVPVEVEPLLAQVVASLPKRPGVAISVECPATLSVSGDAGLLEEALANVATNALEHTEAGSVTLRGRRDNGSVVIEVTDTGSGVLDDERERLFERFYRAGGHGFGLGLSIAREAVTALGGEIDFDSEPAAGTTVRILLPAAQASR